MTDTISPVFGTYSLPALRGALLGFCNSAADNKLGRWYVSLLRKTALVGLSGPFDLTTPQGLNLRLYPFSNRCEKRMIAGSHLWDAPERAALVEAIHGKISSDPFIFFDVGANVGLYSLTSWKAAKDAGKVLKAFAIEPDDINGGRLCFNTQASHADIVHIPFAVGGSSGVGKAVGGEKNRGEVRIAEADKPSDNDTDDGAIIIKTLADIVDNQHVDEIDAMKVDVEGHDFAALETFFQQAPKTMWPKLLIIETGRGPSKVLELCVANGYSLDRRTQINAILTLSDPAGNE